MRGQEEMGLGGRDEDNRLNGEKGKERKRKWKRSEFQGGFFGGRLT
jgi:hypothetical protein